MAGIPGYRTATPEGVDLAKDRLYLESAVGEQSPEGSGFSDLLASSCERQFFEMALRNKRINLAHITLRWEATACSKETLHKQLDDFLVRNKGMKAHSAVEKLQDHLAGLLDSL